MKNILLLLSIICLFFPSCAQKKSQREIEYELRQEELNKRRNEMADSIVNLSFKGIFLGQPFDNSIKNARKSESIQNVSIKKIDEKIHVARCKTKILLPTKEDKENNAVVEVSILSYQDTITRIYITSNDYDTHSSLKYLYWEKYNRELAVESKEEESWSEWDTSIDIKETHLWTYKNQSVKLTEFQTQKREYYVKDASKHYYENRYDVSYTTFFDHLEIEYIDSKHTNKYNTYRAIKEKREKILADSIKHIEDSIKKIKDSIENAELKQKRMNQDF